MKHNLRITVILISLFLISQLVGIGVVHKYTRVSAVESSEGVSEYSPLPFNMERPDIDQNISPFYILSAIIVGTIFLLIMMRYKLGILWKGWYLLAVIIALMITLKPFLGAHIALLSAVIFGVWKIFRPGVIIHNLTEILIYAGIAVIFVPILNILSVSILLILISLYDAYAVWKSKHMIKLAKMQENAGIFAGLFVPYSKIRKRGSSSGIPYKKNDKASQKKIKVGLLGGGDMAFPLLFSGVIMNDLSIFGALLTIIGSTAALSGLFFFSKKERFYPAMPFISAGSFLGLLIIYAVRYLL